MHCNVWSIPRNFFENDFVKAFSPSSLMPSPSVLTLKEKIVNSEYQIRFTFLAFLNSSTQPFLPSSQGLQNGRWKMEGRKRIRNLVWYKSWILDNQQMTLQTTFHFCFWPRIVAPLLLHLSVEPRWNLKLDPSSLPPAPLLRPRQEDCKQNILSLFMATVKFVLDVSNLLALARSFLSSSCSRKSTISSLKPAASSKALPSLVSLNTTCKYYFRVKTVWWIIQLLKLWNSILQVLISELH